LPLARTTVPPGQPGHLSLDEDERGLHVLAQLDKSDSDSVTLLRKIQSGLLASMSFGFRVTKQTWSDDRTLRTIQAVDLNRGDVSVVGQPANHATTVDARGRRNGQASPLSLYVYRARALALRDLHIRNEPGRRR
jgi:HK97 family phage prohead protease